MNDIRWRQRFQNFEKAFQQLSKAANIKTPSETERAGLIQIFEITFELAWKTLKDYLEKEGFQVQSPRETIKQAYQAGFIQEADIWLEALESRNLTTHTYDEAVAEKVSKMIHDHFFKILENCYQAFSDLSNPAFGLTQDEIQKIQNVLSKYVKVRKVLVIGSRALGSQKKASDIDLVLQGDLTLPEIAHIKAELEQLTIPYFFDVIHYEEIKNPDLKDHVDRFGKLLSK